MNMTDLLASLMLDTNENYSSEMNDAINMHNSSIASFAQGVTATAIVSLLIKKNIISDTEFLAEIEDQIAVSKQKETIEYNRDVLLQCIEQEHEYMQQLQEMHESLINQDGSFTINPNASTIFEDDGAAEYISANAIETTTDET